MTRLALAVIALLCSVSAPALGQLALTTIFDSDESGEVGGAFYFDLTVKQKTTLIALDCNTTASASTAIGLEVWMTPETRGGKQLDPSLWSLVAEDDGTAAAAGVDRATRVTLREPLSLQPGRYGIALIASGTGHRYSQGGGTYGDGFLSIDTGEASSGAFAGTLLTQRTWNGRLIYGPSIPKGPFLYAYDDQFGAVHAFALDKKSGAPGQLLGSPFAVTGGAIDCTGNCQTLASDAKGTFLFAATAAGLAVLRKLPGGALEEVSGSPFVGASRLLGVRAWESGTLLRVLAVANPGGVLNVFAIDRASGAATLLPSPPSIGDPSGGVGLAVSKGFAYVANDEDRNVHGFSIDAATGALTPTPGSPYALAGYSRPSNLVLDPKATTLITNDCVYGNYLYSAVDKTTGALTYLISVGSPAACTQVFGFSSKGTFYGGGSIFIDAYDVHRNSLGSTILPPGNVLLGLVEPKGTSIYAIDDRSLLHCPIDKRLLLPNLDRTTRLGSAFERPPTGLAYVAK
ncbi:MAG: hypothetical protein JNM84_21225 [Planctomycetes bacterium]|nr:hypothetical protein [Planctomycetota bacterium]